jgi:hypothetical protein
VDRYRAYGWTEEELAAKKKEFDDQLRQALREYRQADPRMELEKALANGDDRFVGLMGFAAYFPGTEDTDFYVTYGKTHGGKIIPFTSDALESDTHEKFQRVARDYAEEYNRLLLERIEKERANQSD